MQKLGAKKIRIDSVDIGHFEGDVTFTPKTEWYWEKPANIMGKTNGAIIDFDYSLEFEILCTGINFSSTFQQMLKLTSAQTVLESATLYFGNPSATTHEIEVTDNDDDIWFFYKVMPPGGQPLIFSKGKPLTLTGVWEGLADETKDEGKRFGYFHQVT